MIGGLLGGGLALALLASLGCSPAKPAKSVVLVSIDTLRADRVGAYGRAEAGTPNLDRLARLGTRFDQAMAPTPVTLPSHATLLTGLDPRQHGIRHNGLFALAGESVTLAERLGAAGFRTAGFVASAVLHPRHGLAQGFESYGYFDEAGRRAGSFFLEERSALEVNADALAWLDGVGVDEPFLLFVHYMEPHSPYLPPEPQRSRHAGDPYQGEVATVDVALGALLDAIHQRGRLQSSLVIVTSDHGESLGDHSEVSHGIFLYQSTLRVPLLIAGNGLREDYVVTQPVGLTDVVPTVLDYVGLEVDPAAAFPGRSLVPALRGESIEEAPLYAETWLPRLDYGWSPLFSLRRGDLKWIEAPRPELYDLAVDPGEQSDLASAEPTRARALAQELTRMRAAAAGEAARAELTADDREALAALGYLSGVHEGTDPEYFADPKDEIVQVAAFNEASLLAMSGRTDEAETALAEIVARNPLMFDARVRWISLLVELGRIDDAVREAHALIEAAAPIPNGHRVASRAHLLLGGAHADAGEHEQAIVEFEAAIRTPQPDWAYESLAASYRALGRETDAASALARAGGSKR
jgi:arylsulfatase A-like enzyme